MSHSLGLLLSFVALFGWGFGDFFIQRATRVVGDWKALFFITFASCLGILPFVWGEFALLTIRHILLFILIGAVVTFASLFDFEALKQGKIAVIEPIMSLELPFTVLLSITIGQQQLHWLELTVITLIFFGIMFAVAPHHKISGRRIFEKGAILAGVGAIAMSLQNFLIGTASVAISPTMTIWFAHTVVAIICAFVLLYRQQFHTLLIDLKRYPGVIIGESVLDTVAWVAYATAATMIPLAIVTAISESYVALVVLLGLLFNKEKLQLYQKVGVAGAVIGVILLSLIS